MTNFIEKLATKLGLIPEIPVNSQSSMPENLACAPPPDQWDDWVEVEARGWPAKRVERHYDLVPTTCFNCESACGLIAYVDKETQTIRKFEGNPVHPASRGRLCAKGPATINQINDSDRILHPLRRVGKRGEGKWEKITWQEALETVASRIRKALEEEIAMVIRGKEWSGYTIGEHYRELAFVDLRGAPGEWRQGFFDLYCPREKKSLVVDYKTYAVKNREQAEHVIEQDQLNVQRDVYQDAAEIAGPAEVRFYFTRLPGEV